MATLNLTGFESGGTAELQSLTGTASVQSSIKRTGTYAFRSNPTTTALGWCLLRGFATTGILATYNVATVYHRFYFRVDTLPAANNEPIFTSRTTTSTVKLELRVTSAGNLQAYDTGGVQLGSDGATTLSTGTWYRIEVQVGTGAAASYEIKIDGVSELSGTGDLNTGNNLECTLGKQANRNSQTVDFYYDDVRVSDSAFPGAGEVKVLKPTADGSTQQWTAGTGASDWQEVDEIPTSDAEYVQSTAGAGEIALFAMQDTATVGITGTVNALINFCRTREDATVTSSNFIRLKSGATSSDNTSGLNGSTTVVSRGKAFDVDPDTAVAWTLSGVDAIECGSREANAVAMRLTTVLVMVDYTPAAGTTVTPTTAALTLTSFAPKLLLSVTPSTKALTTTKFAPQLKETLTPSTLALSLSTFAPAVRIVTLIIPSTASLSTSTFAPKLFEVTTPTTASLSIATFEPTITIARILTPTTASLSLSAFAPKLLEALTPATGSLTLATFAPSVTIGQLVTPASVSLSLSTFAPKLSESLSPSTVSLSLTTFAPSVTIGQLVTPSTASLTLSSFAPKLLEVTTPATRALVLNTFAPLAQAGVIAQPGAASLSVSTFAPSLHERLTPTTKALSLAINAPSTVLNTITKPSTVSLSVSGFAPSLRLAITPTTLGLSTSTFVPTISTTANITVSPAAISLTLSMFAPIVSGAVFGVTPQTINLVITSYAPNAVNWHARYSVNISTEAGSIWVSNEERTVPISKDNRVF